MWPVDTGIGTTFRDARKRRKVDLSEVEEAIKIRARFLRAMENEEWDVLPGGVYTRAFVRTYASFLGLDGERLADEYGSYAAPGGGERAPRVDPGPGARRRWWRPSGQALAALVSLALVAMLVGIGLTGGKDASVTPNALRSRHFGKSPAESQAAPTAEPGVAVELKAEAEVWVCLLDTVGRPLVNGQVLEAGTDEGPFRSAGFSVSFGNGEVTMTVDGEKAEIPTTSSPVGYAIDSAGELRQLSEAERPTCT
jgi:hypothetical protein